MLIALTGCGRPAAAVPSEVAEPQARAAAPKVLAELEGGDERRLQIRQDVLAIQAECEHAAGGDWTKWQEQTARYRAVLKARLDGLKHQGMLIREALVGRDQPFFETNPRMNLAHLVDPDDWNEFRKARPVVAASRWLRDRGIDLIFVTVPAMPEVYVEHFLADVPSDGIIAPHVRKTLLELLENDVETIDSFRLMRSVRHQCFEFLPADHHWNQFGMSGTVRETARRLGRYRFGRNGRQAPPCTRTVQGPYTLPPSGDGTDWCPIGRNLLSEDQWQAALGTLPRTMDYVTAPDGSPLVDDPRSPVALIGDSFALNFQELLVRETNLPLRSRWAYGNTTEAFAGFLREPEALAGVRVVVWLTSNDSLYKFRNMPEPVLATLRYEN
jgi:hypothetical protein